MVWFGVGGAKNGRRRIVQDGRSGAGPMFGSARPGIVSLIASGVIADHGKEFVGLGEAIGGVAVDAGGGWPVVELGGFAEPADSGADCVNGGDEICGGHFFSSGFGAHGCLLGFRPSRETAGTE